MADTSNVCLRCGSKLIQVTKNVEKSEQRFPLTVTVFKCSNKVCQDEQDQKFAEQTERKEAQEKMKQERIAAKAALNSASK
jgi:hypothetical protein